jgi:hypothetical protein
MKKLLIAIRVLVFCFTIIAINPITVSAQASKLSGGWLSVDGKDFTVMNDGFFASVSKDSTGAWSENHAGSYTVDNANTISFKVLYSSFPDHIGALNTTEFELKGNMLTIKWFKKLVDAKGQDITSQVPQGTQTQYMRAMK